MKKDKSGYFSKELLKKKLLEFKAEDKGFKEQSVLFEKLRKCIRGNKTIFEAILR